LEIVARKQASYHAKLHLSQQYIRFMKIVKTSLTLILQTESQIQLRHQHSC